MPAVASDKLTLFIYHKDCFDGFTSAWIYSRFVDRDAEFLPARYGDPLPEPNEIVGRRVVVADFSWPRAQMANLLWATKECVVLDHHKTAQAALDGLIEELAASTDPASAGELRLGSEIVFDMERSGAGITWDYFCTNRQFCEVCGATNGHQPGCELGTRPALVNYVEDRDLWRLKLPNAREYNANVYAAPMTFEAWDELHSRSLNEMLSRGEAINSYIHQYGTKALAQARVRRVGVSNVWTVNLPYMNCSDYLSRLMEEKHTDFVMSYFCRDDGRWQFSLRSKAPFDCSEIAKRFGGGGHPQAAGFDVADLSEVFHAK